MDRRTFLKLAGCSVGLHTFDGRHVMRTVSVTDHGADPAGNTDSTLAIGNAATRLVQEGAQVLLFPHGRYRLDSAEHVAIPLHDYQSFEVAGSGSTLLMKKDSVVLSVNQCANVTIRDLSVEWNPLPYTQGVVVNAESGWFDLRIDPGFPLPTNVTILAVESYDRTLRNITKNAFELSGNSITQVSATGEHSVRIAMENSTVLRAGTVVVIRFQGSHDAFRISRSSNITFSNVSLSSSPSMGYNVSFCRDLTFRKCAIGFGNNSARLLSTNADGMHVSNCSGYLTLEDCQFAGMGDDAINIYSPLWSIDEEPGGKGSVLVSKSHLPLSKQEAPSAADRLEVLHAGDLHMLKRSPGRAFAGTRDVADFPSTSLVADLDRVPDTTISRCQFHGNHARAIVAHAQLNVNRCSFQNLSMAAILIAPDSHWMEGPRTENIVIHENSFAGCHYASLDREGTITVDIEQSYARRGPVPAGMASNVQITSNTFSDCATAAISCRSIDGLTIADNRIGQTWVGSAPGPALLAGKLTNSRISGNKTRAANVIRVVDSVRTSVAGNDGFTQHVNGGER